MKIALLSALGLALLTFASGKTLYKETFDSSWAQCWKQSNWKKSEGTAGDWKLTAGDWYGDAEADKGIQTSQDARFYAISTKFDQVIDNKDSDLVIQFQVKFPQKIDCGGGYIKVLPSSMDQTNFGGDSPYEIMFGPDVCGTSTKRVHVILTKDGTNHLIKKTIPCEIDQLSHVYTLILRKDNTYEVRIDGDKKESGSLYDDWDILPPKKIKDPNVSKPADWIDDPMMDDPNDTKPADWDSIPRQIPDPEAEKPEDWDDESDGEWEPPMIDNPQYTGEWKPKRIPNPDYKGAWVHPEIDNPEYKENNELYRFSDLGSIGIELWQVKAGTLFDNILITDEVSEAEQFLNETWKKNKDAEKAMFDKAEKAKRDAEEAERKNAEEQRKAAEKDEDENEDEDEDDEEEKEEKPEKKGHEEL